MYFSMFDCTKDGSVLVESWLMMHDYIDMYDPANTLSFLQSPMPVYQLRYPDKQRMEDHTRSEKQVL